MVTGAVCREKQDLLAGKPTLRVKSFLKSTIGFYLQLKMCKELTRILGNAK